jgi:hypothetical protein
MNARIKLQYDARRSVATLSDGRVGKLKLTGVTREQAEKFLAKHAEQFAQRGFALTR